MREWLVDLQSKIAFQEDTISALDAVVVRQQRQIEMLQELWEQQKDQVEHVLAGLDKGQTTERPPHY